MRISDWSSDVCSSDLRPKPNAKRRNRPSAKPKRPRPAASRKRSAQRKPVLPPRRQSRNGLPALNRKPLNVRAGKRKKRPSVNATKSAASMKPPSLPSVRLARKPSGKRRPNGTALRAKMPRGSKRSEEHTSELQSLMRISYAVFCLKKKNNEKHKQ